MTFSNVSYGKTINIFYNYDTNFYHLIESFINFGT